MKLITLTTDFGLQDWFVGVMKGVIHGIHPNARLVDISHAIPPGDIRAGAFALAAAFEHFPRGTVHTTVVDPGVGSGRRAIAIRTSRYWFVGPDNGVLSLAAQQDEVRAVYELTNPRLFRKPVSHTFHGRDIFAPVAAHLSLGRTTARQLGRKISSFITIPPAELRLHKNVAAGEVVYIDRFGNALTSIPGDWAEPLLKDGAIAKLPSRRSCPLCAYYAAVPIGKPVAVPGSSGCVEIAINGGSAAKQLRLTVGSQVRISRGARD